MIRHTIMWRFTDNFDGMNKDDIMDKITELFVFLKNTIPEIKFMSVERDVIKSERSYDMIYITEFESLESLEVYRVHPEHLKVAEFIGKVRIAQAVTDTVKSEIK
jgi:hypothetical protein